MTSDQGQNWRVSISRLAYLRCDLTTLARAVGEWRRLMATDSLGDCRLHAGRILLKLADAVVYENQTYYRQGLKKQLRDLQAMPRLPAGLLDGYLSIVEARTGGYLKGACEALMATTPAWLDCDIMAAYHPEEPDAPPPPPQAIDFGQLAEDYGEIISSFSQVYTFCESGDAPPAFISAVCLQEPLSDAFSGIDLDVLSAYEPPICAAMPITLEASRRNS